MKIVLITLCLALGVLAQVNEDFDVSEVLANDRVLQAYARCFLNRGPCIPEIRYYKERLPHALESQCAECTEKQKQMGKQLAQALKKRHPELWKELVEKYDPEGKYQAAWKQFLEE